MKNRLTNGQIEGIGLCRRADMYAEYNNNEHILMYHN